MQRLKTAKIMVGLSYFFVCERIRWCVCWSDEIIMLLKVYLRSC